MKCFKTESLSDRHVISEFNGGEININNLRPICNECNLSMGTTNMDVFIKKYKL